MRTRLDGLPAFLVTDTLVEARQFNLVRLALQRLECPLRLSLPHVRGMDLHLERELWVCVDRAINDLPVLAWTDFPGSRNSLHQPVPCRIRHYHEHSGLIVRGVLHDLERLLNERLSALEKSYRAVSSLIPLSRRR